MKGNTVTKISVVFAFFVALGMISCATAIPLTSSEPYTKARNDSLDMLEKITTLKSVVNFDKMQNYLNKKIPVDMRSIIVEKAHGYVDENILPLIGYDETYAEVQAFLFEWCCVFIEMGYGLFGHNPIGFFAGAIIAWIVLVIPKIVLTGAVALSEVSEFINESPFNWDSLVFQFGIIGAFFVMLLIYPIVLIGGFTTSYAFNYVYLFVDVVFDLPDWD